MLKHIISEHLLDSIEDDVINDFYSDVNKAKLYPDILMNLNFDNLKTDVYFIKQLVPYTNDNNNSRLIPSSAIFRE